MGVEPYYSMGRFETHDVGLRLGVDPVLRQLQYDPGTTKSSYGRSGEYFLSSGSGEMKWFHVPPLIRYSSTMKRRRPGIRK
ncbi:hypothetical protein SUGI_1522700 [Cryptomeria japonica]|uniref:Uncharacterized protein n=1 Tax=Cryptomeria japonica TaxID=3369 RepID=A0AAD3NST4_CRYJA|nr:hypothetical protein SUGI_1499780 [Cryptomeria japonica]GLJ59775.1 hypothetical protein SUGI_1522700 [Cryptomeria japonica]